jgi:hypothetical protein
VSGLDGGGSGARLSSALTGLGLVADASDLISPQNSGVMGMIDRVAAGSNAAAIILRQGFERGLIKFQPATADGPTAAAPEGALAETGNAPTMLKP